MDTYVTVFQSSSQFLCHPYIGTSFLHLKASGRFRHSSPCKGERTRAEGSTTSAGSLAGPLAGRAMTPEMANVNAMNVSRSSMLSVFAYLQLEL